MIKTNTLNIETCTDTFIIIILANQIPYIYKVVSTLPVHGEYSLLELDKGQLYQVGEKFGR